MTLIISRDCQSHPTRSAPNGHEPSPTGSEPGAEPDPTSPPPTPCSRFALSVRVSLPLMLAVVGILPLVIWLADLLPPLAGMA